MGDNDLELADVARLGRTADGIRQGDGRRPRLGVLPGQHRARRRDNRARRSSRSCWRPRSSRASSRRRCTRARRCACRTARRSRTTAASSSAASTCATRRGTASTVSSHGSCSTPASTRRWRWRSVSAPTCLRTTQPCTAPASRSASSTFALADGIRVRRVRRPWKAGTADAGAAGLRSRRQVDPRQHARRRSGAAGRLRRRRRQRDRRAPRGARFRHRGGQGLGSAARRRQDRARRKTPPTRGSSGYTPTLSTAVWMGHCTAAPDRVRPCATSTACER